MNRREKVLIGIVSMLLLLLTAAIFHAGSAYELGYSVGRVAGFIVGFSIPILIGIISLAGLYFVAKKIRN